MIEAATPSLLVFALTCLVIELTPGPNMAYLAALTLSRGRNAGLAAVAGIALGLAIYGAAAALGLAALIERSDILYETLRWAGVVYLLWLAWESWASEADVTVAGDEAAFEQLRTAFRRGLITNLLNPKAAIFYIAMVPTFVKPHASVVTQTLTLSAIFVSIATLIHLGIVLLAGRLHGPLSDPARRRPVRRMLAVALAAIAIWFAVSTAR